MGIGHVAVGLGLNSAAPRLNAGYLIFSAFFADFLLGCFVLARLESYRFPAEFASNHYMEFTFPWSHGMLPLIGWGCLLGGVAWLFRRDARAAFLIGLAVVSHFLLDGIVHVKGLPVAGPGTWELGLGLWRDMPAALGLEALMMLTALVLYWRATRGGNRTWRIAMLAYGIGLGVFLIAGQISATPAPRGGLIAGWLLAPAVFSWMAGIVDRKAGGGTPVVR